MKNHIKYSQICLFYPKNKGNQTYFTYLFSDNAAKLFKNLTLLTEKPASAGENSAKTTKVK